MRFTYRTYRIALNVYATFGANQFGTLELATESWGYRIWNAQGVLLTELDPEGEDAEQFFSGALNSAIATVNQVIADSELPPAFQPITNPF